MSYPALTPAAFKLLKPQFAEVDDAVVQQYIDMGGRMVDTSWTQLDYTNAWAAFTCHLMTLEGLGTDAQSQAFASGASEFQTIKSGELTLTRFKAAGGDGGGLWSWMGSTPCGRYYVMLLRMNRAGPVGISVAGGGCTSPYAKDLPILRGWRF
jgi:hypothetical protein